MNRDPVRIAILGSRGVPARYGGFETFAEELGARLSQQGISVTVFCEQSAGSTQVKTYRGMDLEYVHAPSWGPLRTIIFDALSLIRARKKFDVVYMLGYSASICCFLPRLYGSSVWINMDGVEWTRRKWSWFARAYLFLSAFVATLVANRIIADSGHMATVLKRRFARVPNCTTIAYGAESPAMDLDTRSVELRGLSQGQYYIVVCRAEPENHVLEIMQGFLNSNTNKTLVIVANIEPRSPYGKNLLHFSGNPRVRFLGTVYEKADLLALRSGAFAYIHGHSVGGTNPSLLEAMASRSPIIAHDNPFNREVAEEGALYFRSADDLPLLIARVETEPQLRQRVSALAGTRAATHYSWDRIAGQYLELIRRTVVAKKGFAE